MPNSKPLTPLSDKAKALLTLTSRSSSTTAEDKPRSVSRGPAESQRPAIRPMPRIDKSSAAAAAESRRRLSSSSVPRGRSSSPSDFTRILSDMRRARVPVPENRRPVSEVSEGSVGNGKRMSGFRGLDRKGSRESGVKASERPRVYGEIKNKLSQGISVADDGTDLKSCLNESSPQKTEDFYGLPVPEENSAQVPTVLGGVSKEKQGIGAVLGGVSTEKQGIGAVLGGVSKEKQGIGGQVGDKHNSMLHEKLAFLEGKVKRIASDIKRTKEMLDMNDPDASKVIISDIQEKISGIEKAISHVVGDSGRKSSFSKNTDRYAMQAKEEVFVEKISVKGLNIDELEARLLPHQKLLKGRSLIKRSSSGSESDRFVLPKSHCESSSAHVSVSCPIDENPIAIEFLASLKKLPYEVSMDVCNELEVSEVHEPEVDSESPAQQASHMFVGKHDTEVTLTSDEQLDEFDDQENRPVEEDKEDDEAVCKMREIGSKVSTGGWFVSEGESVLLVHDDGSCSLHDIANSEEKSMYKPPSAISSNIWRDCWIVLATSADGCSGKYVVAASAGNTLESGFCSWDFYNKEVRALHIEDKIMSKRSVLAPLNESTRRYTSSTIMPTESRQWWYKPSGPLVVSTASSQRSVQIFDVRDGERIMKWDLQRPVLPMDNSSPLQWRNRGKLVIAEADAITLWDVGSLNPRALLSVPASGHKISALHVSNTDAEVGGGVRQRITSSEAEGHDGVFCTADSVNILDFRQPSGIGLKIRKPGVTAQSIFSRGDSVFLGCNIRPPGKTQSSSQVEQFSLRRQKVVSTYVLPESNAHHHTSLNQVWGNSDLVMGVCGQGLFVFDILSDDEMPSFALDYNIPQKPKEAIGPDYLCTPSFDYASSQVLLISSDRPAMFKYL